MAKLQQPTFKDVIWGFIDSVAVLALVLFYCFNMISIYLLAGILFIGLVHFNARYHRLKSHLLGLEQKLLETKT